MQIQYFCNKLIYGAVDKKTSKIKRDMALLLLKSNQYDEALNEVIQVEEQEKSLYGETSLQLGRTYKLIGTLYILRRKQNEAKVYLQKAQTIFELKGATKLLKEVKNKLNILRNSVKMDEELADEENKEDSEDDGSEDVDTAEDKNNDKMKKSKKSTSKLKKKKPAVRNNFVGTN